VAWCCRQRQKADYARRRSETSDRVYPAQLLAGADKRAATRHLFTYRGLALVEVGATTGSDTSWDFGIILLRI
jgi:hypothetical protein